MGKYGRQCIFIGINMKHLTPLDMKELVVNEDLVEFSERDTPIDLNLIDRAMFSKNKNTAVGKKIINFKNGGTLTIEPPDGGSQPTSFEEDIFFVLLNILYSQANISGKFSRTIYTTYTEIADVLGVNKEYYKSTRFRASLEKLAKTSYTFENSLIHRDIDKNIDTSDKNITDFKVKSMSMRSIFRLIDFTEIKMSEFDVQHEINNNKYLDLNDQDLFEKLISEKISSQTSYFIRIDIGNFIYENLLNKVYLKHSLYHLLKIKDKIARGIYMYLDSNQGKEVKENGYYSPILNKSLCIVTAETLAEHGSITWESKRVSNSILIINRALDYLVETGYIKSYEFYREKPLPYSWYKVYFYEYQSRANEYYNYSTRKIGKAVLNKKSEQKINYNYPDMVATSLERLPELNNESRKILYDIYVSLKDEKVIYNNKELISSSGELKALAILDKIHKRKATAPVLTSVNGYFITVATKDYYEEELISLKIAEYDRLYKVNPIKENQLKIERKKLKDNNTEDTLKESWQKISANEQSIYISLAAKYAEKLKTFSPIDIAIHIYSYKILNQNYMPGIKLLASTKNIDLYQN